MIMLLVDELRNDVEKIVKDFCMETKTKSFKAPQAVAGFLPSKKATEVPDFPFVIVRPTKGQINQTEPIVTVRCIIGTYSEDEQNGWRDVANIIQRIWNELFRKRVVGKKFRLEDPLEFDIPDDQPAPYWMGMMTLRFVVPQMIEEVEY